MAHTKGYKHTCVGKESVGLRKWWNRMEKRRGEEWPVWWLIWDICRGRGEACFAGNKLGASGWDRRHFSAASHSQQANNRPA